MMMIVIFALLTLVTANSPDIFMLHLHIGVYVLFLRLYGMFPCTFLSFLRLHYAKKENLMVYNDVIAVSMMSRALGSSLNTSRLLTSLQLQLLLLLITFYIALFSVLCFRTGSLRSCHV